LLIIFPLFIFEFFFAFYCDLYVLVCFGFGVFVLFIFKENSDCLHCTRFTIRSRI